MLFGQVIPWFHNVEELHLQTLGDNFYLRLMLVLSDTELSVEEDDVMEAIPATKWPLLSKVKQTLDTSWLINKGENV